MSRRDVDPARLREIMRRVPGFCGAADFSIARVGGAGNRAFRVECGAARACLRLADRDRYIGHDAERHNAMLAHRLGLAPRVLHADAEAGVLVTEWLADCEVADRRILDRAAARRGLVEALARLHGSRAPFRDAISPERALDWNLRNAGRGAQGGALYRKARAFLRAHPVRCARNCHGDPVSSNLLRLAGGEWRLIDWEYSHRTTPCWDLAVVLNDLDASDAECRTFCEDYNASLPALGRRDPVEPRTLRLYRGVLALVGALWLEREAGAARLDDAARTRDRQLILARRFLS